MWGHATGEQGATEGWVGREQGWAWICRHALVAWVPENKQRQAPAHFQHLHALAGHSWATRKQAYLASSNFAEVRSPPLTAPPTTAPSRAGRSRGYGFVSFRQREEAEAAIGMMHGQFIGARRVRCGWAQHKTDGIVAMDPQILDRADPTNTNVYVGNLAPALSDTEVRGWFVLAWLFLLVALAVRHRGRALFASDRVECCCARAPATVGEASLPYHASNLVSPYAPSPHCFSASGAPPLWRLWSHRRGEAVPQGLLRLCAVQEPRGCCAGHRGHERPGVGAAQSNPKLYDYTRLDKTNLKNTGWCVWCVESWMAAEVAGGRQALLCPNPALHFLASVVQALGGKVMKCSWGRHPNTPPSGVQTSLMLAAAAGLNPLAMGSAGGGVWSEWVGGCPGVLEGGGLDCSPGAGSAAASSLSCGKAPW